MADVSTARGRRMRAMHCILAASRRTGRAVKFRGTQWVFVLSLLSVVTLHAQGKIDSSTHTVQMIPVEKDVSLEVLDWGRHGPTLGSANRLARHGSRLR